MFDQEVIKMQRCLMFNLKNKKYKQIAFNLAKIEPDHKKMVL